MSAVLIVNPYATNVTEERLAAVAAVLSPHELVRTRAAGEATVIARELPAGVDTVYVFSGDGTYNEVLNGLARDVTLGFLPGGGTSVLPRALGLPRNPVAAARALALGRTRRIGLGRVNGRRFAFNAGLGLDAELVRMVDGLGRNANGKRPGDSAFVRVGIKALARHHFRLDPVLELVGIGRAAFAMAANCSPYTYAGRVGLKLAPGASFDGGIDIVAPERVLVLPVLGWWALGRGRRHVRAHDADRVEARCDHSLPLQVDGEDIGDHDHVVFEAERDAVTVLV
ncbi:MAG: diacylglycerol kinase family protein [Gaiellales bacterium]